MPRADHADLLISLAFAVCDGRATEEQVGQLDGLLDGDPAARLLYLECLDLHSELEYRGRRFGLDRRIVAAAGEPMPQEPSAQRPGAKRHSGRSEEPSLDRHSTEILRCAQNDVCAPNDDLLGAKPPVRPSLFPSFLAGLPSAYAMALFALGIGVLAAVAWHLCGDHRGVQSGRGVQAAAGVPLAAGRIGQITAMADCRWVDPRQAVVTGAAVPLGREFALAAGRLEITYDTGEKIVLEGPARYVAESRNGGFLSLGKLTAKVENTAASGAAGGTGLASGTSAPGAAGLASGTPEARIRNLEDPNHSSPSHLLGRLLVRDSKTGDASYLALETVAPMVRPRVFYVRTGATATRPSPLRTYRAGVPQHDDSTEFSVEVDKLGMTAAHVLRGTVDLHILSPADTYDYEVSLVEAQFVRLEFDADGSLKMMAGLSGAGPGALAGELSRPVPVCSVQATNVPPKSDQRKKQIN